MRDRSQNRGERGFTLIELVLVIVILGILGAVVALNLGGLDDMRVDTAARKVIADLRYAQQMATTTGIRHGLRVGPGVLGYSVYRDDDPPVGETVIDDPLDLGSPFTVTFSTFQQGQFAGVEFGSATPFCGAAEIEFNGFGAPTNNVGGALGCPAAVTLNYSGNVETINIEQATGKISN